MVTAERARELLSSVKESGALEQLSRISTIRLSNKSFGQDSAEVVAGVLREMTGIKVADISDIIAGRHEDDALVVLKIICSAIVENNTAGLLEEVNVSENALGRKGLIACQDLLQVPSVRRFYFCNNGLSAEASELITEILLASPALVDGALPFTTLHFYNNMSGENGAKASARLIEKCPNLEDLRYSATRAGKEGCAAIVQAMSGLRKLKRVDLADSSFSDENMSDLVDTLSKQPQLAYLNIRDGGLESEGIESLATELAKSKPPLEYIDLSGNDASEESLEPISVLLTSISDSLEEFILDDSEVMDIEAIKDTLIPALGKLSKLHTLSLCGCTLTAAAAVAVARCVCKIETFKLLKLDGNEICEEGVALVMSILAKHGKTLGPMEDNDEEGENDLDDENDGNDEDDDVQELGESLSAAAISS